LALVAGTLIYNSYPIQLGYYKEAHWCYFF
jgi:hypothetical protein